MTFLHYMIGNAIAAVLVTALLIYFSPKSREERMKRRLRKEEELFNALVEYAKREKESKPNPDFAPPPEKKPHGYHLTMTTDDAKDYGKTRTFNGEEYERTMVAQSADGTVISMIYRRKYPQPIQSFIGEVRGGLGNEVMGTVTAKSAEELEEKLKALSGTLDRTDKKPVTPERLKEAGLETEPVTVSKPMSRVCKNCRHFQKFGGEEWGSCDRNEDHSAAWMTCGMFVPVDGPIISCGSCRHFVPDGAENVCNTGLCGEMDMTTVRNYGGCGKYAKKEDARPAPLGTVTIH